MTRLPRGVTFRIAATATTVAALAVSLFALGVATTTVVLAVLLGVGAVTVAGTACVLRRHRNGHTTTLATQLNLVILLVIAPLVAALVVLGLAMFVAGADATLVGVIAALAGVLGVAAAGRLAAELTRDVTTIRDGIRAVGQGERSLGLAVTSATELRELAAETAAMAGRLAAGEAARERSEDARRHLVAHASHDLRTPVTSLALLAGAINDDLVDGELRREYVRRMCTHIRALSGLIDDLFEISRLEAGDISWTLERVAVEELVTKTVAAMRADADTKGVRMALELPTSLAPVQANPEKLQRVLFNLIQNAIRHSPADGTVVVRAESLADMVEVEVEDRGRGIPTGDRERIFESFERGGDGSRSEPGAGLGLSVARAIVHAHGGRIWVAPAEQGTRMRFSVPVAISDACPRSTRAWPPGG
ncbi:sensor histidine kinase KdpD [Conexibacter sp. DBS9H8]|uniref:sensor histidine kinase n=1 Tax=Conexibacter sp. DBS9H8 TaxID=2937801 RepID=UPI00200C4CAB|nr:HAMP domain-containing sensor histidine kinase [Conexibacter sp. DBS9H8]